MVAEDKKTFGTQSQKNDFISNVARTGTAERGTHIGTKWRPLNILLTVHFLLAIVNGHMCTETARRFNKPPDSEYVECPQ
jgi:hypothetical protein